MIPELTVMAGLTLIGLILLIVLSEDETLEEWSERRHVNRLADGSRRQAARRKCKYAWAMITPGK